MLMAHLLPKPLLYNKTTVTNVRNSNFMDSGCPPLISSNSSCHKHGQINSREKWWGLSNVDNNECESPLELLFDLFWSLVGINSLNTILYLDSDIYKSNHCIPQDTYILEMPVPSQGHYGFHSFPVVDWFCLFIYLWVLTFPLWDCSELGHFVITLIFNILRKV